MAPIDPTRFHPHSVADTCSVWNILSSRRLGAAAAEAKLHFCMTSFVRYECLDKRRTAQPTPAEAALKESLRAEQARGSFQAHSCDLGDLQSVQLLEQRKRLGAGELSTIAFAMKIGQAVLSDDRKACRLAIEAGHEQTQTTPQMLAFLYFAGRLGDSDVQTVMRQHEESGRGLRPHFERAYEQALICKLAATPRP